MKNKKVYILSVIVCLLPMILGIILYDKLPSEMAVHFNVSDVPNNFASKEFALFGLPALMALMQLLIIVVMHSRLKDVEDNSSKCPAIISVLYYWIIPFISILVYLLMVGYSLNIFTAISALTTLPLGILFIVIGNYLPKVNYEVGKHMTHPEVKSEKAFRRNTKIMGIVFVLLGIAFALFSIIRFIK